MAHAPVDVVIIGFPDNNFTGRIVPAVQDLIDSDTIRLLDLLIVSKDADGTLASLAVADFDGDGAADLVALDIAEPGWLSHEDAEEIDDDLPPNSTVALLAYENVWATRLVSALRDANAVLIDQIRIPAQVVEELRAAQA